MTKWTLRRTIALALGVWIAIAPAMLVVPAAPIAMQMSMSAGAAPGDCNGCPDATMDRNICVMMCANTLNFALFPEQDVARPVVFQFIDWPVRHLPLTGRDLVPDPGPPRPI